MSSLQDFEQEFLRCWEITEDLDLLAEENEHDDDLSSRLLGIKQVYDMRFNKAWSTYEDIIIEHYKAKREKDSVTNSD